MTNKKKYVAFFDLLGTQNISVNEQAYYENISSLQKSIIEMSSLLTYEGNKSNIGFFSDSCYIESNNVNNLILFLVNLRNDLITKDMFFNATIIETDLKDNKKSFEYYTNTKEENKVSGIMFYDPSIARAYVEQIRYKGIGINLCFDNKGSKVIQDDKIKMTKNLYMETHDDIYKTKTYIDICIYPSSNLEEFWLSKIFEDYCLACCDNSRYGKYYISLLENILYSSDASNIRWNHNEQKFESAPLIFNMLFDIVTKKSKHEMLTGIDILAFSLIDRIYSSNLDKSVVFEITDRFLENEAIGKNYLTNLEKIPSNAFLSENARNNIENFKKHCRTNIVSKQFRNDTY